MCIMVILQTEVKIKINIYIYAFKRELNKIKFDIHSFLLSFFFSFFLLTKYFMYVVHVIEFSNICALTLLPWLSKVVFFSSFLWHSIFRSKDTCILNLQKTVFNICKNCFN